MRIFSLLGCLFLSALLFNFCAGDPLWKVFCETKPIFRGRADPIVEPGTLSQHSHKVFGASNFGIGTKAATSLEYFDFMLRSSCTSCSISADLSSYWIPDLYYQWPNGSFSLVPNGGMTVYYPSRTGPSNRTHGNWKAFPDGLRMTAGSPWRRSFDGSTKQKAISYACLGGNIGHEPNGFPTGEYTCPGGLRAQVWFPMCWNGRDLDAPNHQDHMSFPVGDRPDGGDCPATHPVRLPGIFFEVLFDVNTATFPHGQGRQPFVWANGDPTGYGLHADFLNGWDASIVQKAIDDPTCDAANTNNGNNVRACNALARFVKDDYSCNLSPAVKVNTTEDLGIGHLIDKLPGCNPVSTGATTVTPCFKDDTPVTLYHGVRRVLLRSKANNKYISNVDSTIPAAASVAVGEPLFYSEVFLLSPTGTGDSFRSEQTGQVLRASQGGTEPLYFSRGSASGWETFNFVNNDDGTVSIQAQSNNKYLSLLPNGDLLNSATTIGANEKFEMINANGQTQSDNHPTSLPSAGPRPTYPPNSPPADTTSNNPGSIPAEDNDSSASSLSVAVFGLLLAVLLNM